MDAIISSERIKVIRNIYLEEETNVGYIDHLFHFLGNNTDIKINYLGIKNNYLGILLASTLASTICKVRSTQLDSSMKITLHQVETILQSIDLECRLNKLELGYWKALSGVDLSPLLKVQDVKLKRGWHLRTLQKFCKTIAKSPESELKMKHLSLYFNNLSSLDPFHLASACSNMRVLTSA